MDRKTFFRLFGEFPPHDLQELHAAYWIGKRAHGDQMSDDGERYFNHPRNVCVRLLSIGVRDIPTLVLAILHDTLEDTFVPPSIIVKVCGASVWNDLCLLSKELPSIDPISGRIIGKTKKPSSDDYYRPIAEGPERVRLVKCADRLDNLQVDGMRRARELKGKWQPERVARYLVETETYVIPIAEATSQILTIQLKEAMEACQMLL